ncbi:MAG: nucleotide exchange factor GrpE [Chlamydiota bacterium]|nr:nucleotide exchange factor GrpE [Chlamydiota bacterium]
MAEANEGEQPLEEESMNTEISTEEAIDQEPVTMSISELEMEKMRYESQDYKDKYLRVLAESENSRKRLVKEKQELVQYSLQNLICDFLVPIDQMENALKHTGKMSEEVKQWSIGFQMILTHFRDVLSNNNVKGFDSLNTAFDPHFHEAVEMIETTEHQPGVVVEECLRGYKMGDRVIRPARVKVAKAPESASETDNTEEQES